MCHFITDATTNKLFVDPFNRLSNDRYQQNAVCQDCKTFLRHILSILLIFRLHKLPTTSLKCHDRSRHGFPNRGLGCDGSYPLQQPLGRAEDKTTAPRRTETSRPARSLLQTRPPRRLRHCKKRRNLSDAKRLRSSSVDARGAQQHQTGVVPVAHHQRICL